MVGLCRFRWHVHQDNTIDGFTAASKDAFDTFVHAVKGHAGMFQAGARYRAHCSMWLKMPMVPLNEVIRNHKPCLRHILGHMSELMGKALGGRAVPADRRR
jgi:hypothetical protein